MANFDFKSSVPVTTGLTDSNYFFGAASQAAATPSIYQNIALREYLLGSSTSTLSIAAGKTLTASNSLTLDGTDSTTMTFPASSTTVAGLSIANVFTTLQTVTLGAANTGVLASTGYSLTGSNATSMVSLAGTWNTTGAPTAFLLNITNTASDTNSRLVDFQFSGSSRFYLRNTAVVLAPSDRTFTFSSTAGVARLATQDTALELTTSFGLRLANDSSRLAWSTRGDVGFQSSSDHVLEFIDTASNTTAVTLQGYRTKTDASNYERWALQSGAGYFELASETAGTGTDDIDVRLTPAGNGRIDFNNADDAAAAQTGTLTNAPTAGNPTIWVTVKVNGTALAIPAWALP